MMTRVKRIQARGLGRPVTPTCPECGDRFQRALVPFRADGRLLGYFPADICGNDHEYFTEESGAAIKAEAKALGLWGAHSSRKPRRERPAARRSSSPRKPVA